MSISWIENFRADIEGLRGVAVLSVLLFHAGYKTFAGGFVGVDIFFVISGFLITGLIQRQVCDDCFTFKDFYIRRTRRLFPAAFVTIATSFAVACLAFSPQDLTRTGGEAVYATVALSNVFYWLQSGYFDAESIQKPLLHTWSLGVEEQFYLIWPALIVLAGRLDRRLRVSVIIVAGAASFLACLKMMNVDPTAAFFLAPFRIFEFAIGGALASLPALPARAGRVVFGGGVLLVLYSVLFYSEATSFPGLSALPPALGSALMIAGGQFGGLARVLTNAPMRWIGRISYSLYLAHWPVGVFATYIADGNMVHFLKPTILVGSIIAALPLYYLVEQPFRSARGVAADGTAFAFACALAAVTFVPVAASAWANNGWTWRLPPELRSLNAVPKEAHERYLFSRNAFYSKTAFQPPPAPNILVVGDSQASDFLNILAEASFDKRANIKIFPIETRCGALIIAEEKRTSYWTKENTWTIPLPQVASACQKLQDELDKLPEVTTASVIYLVSLWYAHTVPHIAETVQRLQSRTKARIVVVGRKSQHRGGIELANAHGRLRLLEEYAARNRMSETDNINAAIKATVGNRYMDILAYLCPTQERCHVLTKAGMPILFDQSHFSIEGAKFMGDLIREEIVRHLQTSEAVPMQSSICRTGISFPEVDRWHACETTGRWLHEMSASLRVGDALDAKSVVIRGFTFGAARRMTISIGDRVAFSAMIDAAEIKIDLPQAVKQSFLEMRLDFEGPPAISPKSVGQSSDFRLLNFMLQDVTLVR